MFKYLLGILLFCYANFAYTATYMLLPIDYVYDGDTLMTHISTSKLPPPLNKLSIRIRGIDTPEKGGKAKCDKERQLAEDAKNFVIKIIDKNKTMKIENFKWDKFGGRILATIKIDGIDLGKELISNGFAIEYDGKTKTKDWCI